MANAPTNSAARIALPMIPALPVMAPSKRLLSLGLAATRGFGFVDRTEPARALADLHLDLGIPAALGRVIDAFAGAVDVALDGALGVRRGGARGGGEQDRPRFL